MSITALTADELSLAIHARRVSCREVMQALLARIDALNPAHNAIVSLRDADALLRQADARDAELLARGASARLDARHAAGDQGPGADAPASAARTGSPLLRDFVPRARRPDGRSA